MGTPASIISTQYLILNNEFRNSAWLSGFNLNGATAGTISIEVTNRFIQLKYKVIRLNHL